MERKRKKISNRSRRLAIDKLDEVTNNIMRIDVTMEEKEKEKKTSQLFKCYNGKQLVNDRREKGNNLIVCCFIVVKALDDRC